MLFGNIEIYATSLHFTCAPRHLSISTVVHTVEKPPAKGFLLLEVALVTVRERRRGREVFGESANGGAA